MKGKVITKEGFKGVGYKKTVTFEEAQAKALHGMIQELKSKIASIPNVVNNKGLWALSHPVTATGFTFYILAEVADFPTELEEGLITHELPTLTYATCYHAKGQQISESYSNLFQWIEEQGYRLNQQEVTHLEWYPLTQDELDPDFDILIPILVD